MTQTFSSSLSLPPEVRKPIFYTIWQIVDLKWYALTLLAVIGLLVFTLWQSVGGILVPLLAALLLLASVAHIFVPIQFEINGDGIVRNILGRRRVILWEDIHTYRVRRNGVLLIPQSRHYAIDFFRGYFLPVPPSLVPEILYRFRICVDHQES